MRLIQQLSVCAQKGHTVSSAREDHMSKQPREHLRPLSVALSPLGTQEQGSEIKTQAVRVAFEMPL